MADDDDLRLARSVAGDRDALSDLLAEHGPQVRAWVSGRIGAQWQSVLDEDDVMQITYLEAFVNIRGFRPNGITAFVAWLTRIADNNLRDAIKGLEAGKRPDPRLRVTTAKDDTSYLELYDLLAGSSGTPSQVVSQREAHAVLANVIDQLPPDYARVVRLYDLDGRPVSEVAAALGRSEGAVFMLRARAHDRMRELLPSVSKFFSTTA